MRVEKIALLSSGRSGAMDVAGALAMAKDCELGKLVLMAKVAEDKRAFDMLTKALARILEPEHGKRAFPLGKLIATEITEPLHCPKCTGRGTVLKYDNMAVLCDHCNGYGIRWRSNRVRARFTGIPITTWSRREYSKLVSAWVIFLEKETGHAEKKLAPQ